MTQVMVILAPALLLSYRCLRVCACVCVHVSHLFMCMCAVWCLSFSVDLCFPACVCGCRRESVKTIVRGEGPGIFSVLAQGQRPSSGLGIQQ